MKFNKNTTIEAVLKRRLMPRPNLANVKKGDKYPVDGLSKRKEALLAASGDLLDLAVAMQEIETMRASPHKDYPYGDCKDGDAANFGIFRQNWWMIRKCGALKPRPPKSRVRSARLPRRRATEPKPLRGRQGVAYEHGLLWGRPGRRQASRIWLVDGPPRRGGRMER